MLYFGTYCKIKNCNICNYYLHEPNGYYCNYCGGDVDDCKLQCKDCKDTEEISFDCIHCEDNPNVMELDEICNTFIENINIIKVWY